MGQKINPVGLRLQVNRTWESRWFANSKEYGDLLHEDLEIRKSEIGLAVFQKKPEFGPANINITKGTLYSCNVDYVLEDRSTLTFNNERLEDTIINANSLIY